MRRNTKKGFSGLLVLMFVAIIVSGVFFFSAKKETESPLVINDTNQATQTVSTETEAQEAISTQIETPINTTDDGSKTVETPKTAVKTEVKNSTVVSNTIKTSANIKTGIVLGASQSKVEPVKATEPELVVTAGIQPEQTLLLGYAIAVPFTTVNLTARGGDVDIDSLVVERQGLGSDRIFFEVGVVDIDAERSLNANHQYSTHDPFTIKNGETRELTLFGNIKDSTTLMDYQAQSPTLALVGIKTSAKIAGNLPVVGTSHYVNANLTIGSITLSTSGFDPDQQNNLDINSAKQIFTALKGNVGNTESVILKSFAFLQRGSASPDDLANVKICVVYRSDTRCYDTEYDDRYYFADFGDDIQIDKGQMFEVYIKGDIGTTGVGRTVDLDLDSSYDVLAYGLTYKNFFHPSGGEDEGAQPEGSFSTSEYPFYNAYKHTIVGGTAVYIGR